MQRQDCVITPKTCSIICTQEDGKRWMVSKSDARVSRDVRKQYQQCRYKQRETMIKLLKDKSALIKTPCETKDDPALADIFTGHDLNRIREHLKLQFGAQAVFFNPLLGLGQYGAVTEVCADPPLSQITVVKLAKNNASLRAEFQTQAKFAQIGLAPQPIQARDKFLPYFLMSKVDGTVGDLLAHELLESELDTIIEETLQLLFRMCDHNMTHGDLHFKNIAFVKNPRTKKRTYLCLDFASAMPGCDPEIDLLQFIRETYNTTYHKFNRDYLRFRFSTIYEANYGFLTQDHTYLSNFRLKLVTAHRKHMLQPEFKNMPQGITFSEHINLDTDTDSDTEEQEEEGDDEGDDEGDE